MFNKKGFYLGLLLITLLSSCKSYKYEVSEDLQPYVDEYFEILDDNDIKVKDRDFKVVFDDSLTETRFAGVAHGMFDPERVEVSVHPIFWTYLNERQKKILIFHELSHDLFDSLHTNDVFLMQPVMHSRFTSIMVDWDKAVKELIKYIKDAR
tara:strand:- start:768 stop:1223 length:456 start_codon:yes stop_codon:yes gene_type:complete